MTGHVVIDSTCLIALERIDQLALIPRIFPTIIAPPGVQSEFGVPLNWLTVLPVKNSVVVEALKTQLDDGESQAIALALELGNALLILDDKKARRVARQLELRVTGTIGVLIRAKRQGVISAIAPLLTALEKVDFRLTSALRYEALRLCDEEPP